MGWVKSNRPSDDIMGAMQIQPAPKLLSFIGHLEEFRKRIIISLVGVGAATLFCFFFIDEILNILMKPISSQIGEIYFFSPADAFVVKVKAALLAGLLIASPLVVCEFWLFLSPGLYAKEKKALLPVVFIISFLFITGALFCFFTVLPMTLGFLISQQTAYLKPMVSMSEYLGFLSGMMLAFGFAFNLPVFVVALVASGFVRVKTLNQYQRHIIVFIFIAAAVLTPGPDIASQMMLAIPLLVLFEFSVAAGWVVELMRKRKASA